MQLQLRPYERGSYSRNPKCGSRAAGPSVAAGWESDVRTRWCRSAEPGDRGEGRRSHAAGSRGDGSGGCGLAGAGRVGRVGPVGGAGRQGGCRPDARRASMAGDDWAGSDQRIERGPGRRHGALGASERDTLMGPGSGGVVGPPDVEGASRERRRGAKGLVSGCVSERFPCGGGRTKRLRGMGAPEDPKIPCGG